MRLTDFWNKLFKKFSRPPARGVRDVLVRTCAGGCALGIVSGTAIEGTHFYGSDTPFSNIPTSQLKARAEDIDALIAVGSIQSGKIATVSMESARFKHVALAQEIEIRRKQKKKVSHLVAELEEHMEFVRGL